MVERFGLAMFWIVAPILAYFGYQTVTKNGGQIPTPKRKPQIQQAPKPEPQPPQALQSVFDLINNFQSSFSGLVAQGREAARSYVPQTTPAPAQRTNRINVSSLLNLIGRVESNGNYNVSWGGKVANFTNMSVNQVLEWQRQFVNGGSPSSAVGKYQIIRKTLMGLKSRMGLNGNERFTPQLQDQMALELLKQRGLQSYLSGSLSESAFMLRIAQEWASFPRDASGRSYYAGDGLNKALVSPNTVVATLRQVKGVA